MEFQVIVTGKTQSGEVYVESNRLVEALNAMRAIEAVIPSDNMHAVFNHQHKFARGKFQKREGGTFEATVIPYSSLYAYKDGKTFGREVTDWVNPYRSKKDDEAFVEEIVHCHRTLQQKVVGLFAKAIMAVARQESHDLRNEDAVVLARKMTKDLDENDLHMRLI